MLKIFVRIMTNSLPCVVFYKCCAGTENLLFPLRIHDSVLANESRELREDARVRPIRSGFTLSPTHPLPEIVPVNLNLAEVGGFNSIQTEHFIFRDFYRFKPVTTD